MFGDTTTKVSFSSLPAHRARRAPPPHHPLSFPGHCTLQRQSPMPKCHLCATDARHQMPLLPQTAAPMPATELITDGTRPARPGRAGDCPARSRRAGGVIRQRPWAGLSCNFFSLLAPLPLVCSAPVMRWFFFRPRSSKFCCSSCNFSASHSNFEPLELNLFVLSRCALSLGLPLRLLHTHTHTQNSFIIMSNKGRFPGRQAPGAA